MPRARVVGEDGKTREWKSKSLRAYQCRTEGADALIAGADLVKKHKVQGMGVSQYPDKYLRDELGLTHLSVRTRNLPWAKA